MKHLTVFTLLLLLLAGCQTDITTDEDSESAQAKGDSNSETAGGKEVTTGESKQVMLNHILSNELVQLIHDYGIRLDAQIINNDQNRTGIVYAQLASIVNVLFII